MALINHTKKEINAKIVFCGPPAAGKASLLKAVCSRLPSVLRGPIRSMGLQKDRMIFFDFSHPEGRETEAYRVRFHVYTLTGEVTHDTAWKMVLKGVDGLAIVADSDPARQSANRSTLEQVQAALRSNGKELFDVASVVLCTKRDRHDALPLEQIRQGLGVGSLPLIPVAPLSGEGVLDSLGRLVNDIFSKLEELGLILDPAVSELKRLSNAQSDDTLQSIVVSRSDTRDITSELSVGGPLQPVNPEPERPLVSFAGPAQIDGGELRVPLKVNCCNRETTIVMKINIQ